MCSLGKERLLKGFIINICSPRPLSQRQHNSHNSGNRIS